MKKIVITLNLVLLVCIAFAQSNKSGKYDERVQELIQQERNKLVEQITQNNYKQAFSTLQKLKKDFGKDYIVLYPREELMVALATRRFKYFTDSARNYNSAVIDKRKGFVYKDFREELHLYMLPEIMNISQELEESDLPEIDKEIARIYIHYLFSDDISTLNNLINDYQKEHSKTLFANFLNSLKRFTLNSRLNFSLGHSAEHIGKTLKDPGSEPLQLTRIELDGFIRKTYFSLFVGGGFTKIETSYLVFGENDEISEITEDKISSLKYGVKLGRILYASKFVKVYPYVSLGGFEISPSSYLLGNDKVFEPTEIKTGAFYAGAGISSDIVLKRWKTKRMYDPEGYFFVRPNIGYDRFFLSDDILKPNNLSFSISVGVSIGPKK